jgi:surface carbohydrate biosynthesis protein
MNILLPIETASRELYAKVLLAYKFAAKNHISYIGDKSSVSKFSKYVPGAIYFDKGYHKGVSESTYNMLSANDIKLVSLDEENAVDYHNYQQINLRFPDHILSKFDLVFLWGVRQYQYLKNNRSKFDASKTFITGHPRFELLKEKNRSIYQTKTDEYVEKYGDFVLINTNFGLGNNVKGEKFVIDNYGSRFPQIKNLIIYQKKQVDFFIDLSIRLSESLDQKIILRPHPEENIESYKKHLKNYNNVKVISEGSVIPWIMASSSMIHHDCTTGIECAMLSKNSIAYIKDLDRALTTDIPLRISYQYAAISDVITHIKSESAMPLKIDNDILNDYFNFNCNSIDVIVDSTIELITCKESVTRNYFLHQIILIIKNQFKKITKNNVLYENKIKGLDLRNIETVVDEYNHTYGKSIVVKQIHQKLFQLKGF